MLSPDSAYLCSSGWFFWYFGFCFFCFFVFFVFFLLFFFCVSGFWVCYSMQQLLITSCFADCFRTWLCEGLVLDRWGAAIKSAVRSAWRSAGKTWKQSAQENQKKLKTPTTFREATQDASQRMAQRHWRRRPVDTTVKWGVRKFRLELLRYFSNWRRSRDSQRHIGDAQQNQSTIAATSTKFSHAAEPADGSAVLCRMDLEEERRNKAEKKIEETAEAPRK